VQDAEAVFVRDKGNGLAVIGEVEFLDVPGNVRGEVIGDAGRKIQIGEPMKFGIFVAGGVNTLPVAAE